MNLIRKPRDVNKCTESSKIHNEVKRKGQTYIELHNEGENTKLGIRMINCSIHHRAGNILHMLLAV